MFVNSVANYGVTNNFSNNLKNNKSQNNNISPKINMDLGADTVSFGAKDKKNKMNGMHAGVVAAMLTAASAIPSSCTDDYECYHSLESSLTVNIENMHKCGCDSFPVVIPGGKDTIYIPVQGETKYDTIIVEKPGETIHDTILVEKPGETIHDTIYVEKPGETKYDTIYVDVPGETKYDTIVVEKPGETKYDTIYVQNPPDTIYVEKPVHDTIVVEKPVYDTVVVEKPVYDTVVVEKPIYDTVFVDRPVHDTVLVEKPVYDTVFVDRPVHDTIWIKPDTVYIPKEPHFEINDSINKDVDDFDIPSEGDGKFVYAMQGRNEYLGTQHLLIFNGFFSNERVSSFVDHAFDEDDIPEGGTKPTKYYYTRYDIGSDYENGRRVVTMWKPSKGQHQLPDDKKSGAAGWDYAGKFYVRNASVAQTAKLIANDMDGTLKAKFTKNEKRGPGNIYKEWPLNDNQMPKTTIENVKVYRRDLNDLD